MTNLKTVLKQGLDFPGNFIKGRVEKTTKTEADLAPGEGAVIEVNGKKVAAYKKNQKETIMLSPACTHLGCMVTWNKDEKAWDCPCHGSQFTAEGKVVKGPATKDLGLL